MHDRCVAILTVSVLLSVSAYAGNPFLDSQDNKPVSANFRGTEWGDNISQEEIPLTAEVSKRSFGKKELDWLSTQVATVRGPMAIDSNVRQ